MSGDLPVVSPRPLQRGPILNFTRETPEVENQQHSIISRPKDSMEGAEQSPFWAELGAGVSQRPLLPRPDLAASFPQPSPANPTGQEETPPSLG